VPAVVLAVGLRLQLTLLVDPVVREDLAQVLLAEIPTGKLATHQQGQVVVAAVVRVVMLSPVALVVMATWAAAVAAAVPVMLRSTLARAVMVVMDTCACAVFVNS
jgi:hypothetical protein